MNPVTVGSFPHAGLVVLIQIIRDNEYNFKVFDGVRMLDHDEGFSTVAEAEAAGKNSAEGLQDPATINETIQLLKSAPSATIAPTSYASKASYLHHLQSFAESERGSYSGIEI